MNDIVIENSKISLVRSSLILMNYFFAIVGGYKKIASYLISKIGSGEKDISVSVHLIIYIAIIFITVILAYPLIEDSFNKFKKEYFNDLFSILSLMAIILVLIIVVAKSVIGIDISLNQLKNQGSLQNNMFYFIFVTLIYAPIVEEMVFRGVVYQTIKSSYGGITGIFISSLLFGFIHSIYFLNNWNSNETIYFIIYFVMGFALCISYDYSKSILGPVINHFLWNLFTLTFMLFKMII